MFPQRRRTLLESIANTIADYREGELSKPDADHVERWVKQFDQFDKDYQPVILEEMDKLLKASYFSKQQVVDDLNTLVSSKRIFGPDPIKGILNTNFLSIQEKGNSQKDLLALLDSILMSKYSFGLADCGNIVPHSYLYLDDCLFTGNRVRRDIESWLPSVTQSASLNLIFLAGYMEGTQYVRNCLDEPLSQANISFQFWQKSVFNNLPSAQQNRECLWPGDLTGDTAVDNYVQALQERRKDKKFQPRLFRAGGSTAFNNVFSSLAARTILEQAFLRAGIFIISNCKNPKPSMRPMGYEYLESLGFGSTVMTYRNCSNNCPLAIWWGEPTQPAWHPLGKWYPLLSRRVYESASLFNGYDYSMDVNRMLVF